MEGMMTAVSSPFSPGLEGVVAAQTAISSVDGQKGELVIRGFGVEALAPLATFEETLFLLWHDMLPDPPALDRFRAELAAHRALDAATLDLLRAAAARRVHAMDALRMACASITGLETDAAVTSTRLAAARQDALRLVAAFPVIVAAYQRL